ncbi:MAG: hypothetical protein LPK09_01235 [Hymenobacteraceae bacterium]|nr:hypothetical protein [Hymenobacteraceae bacterium]
MELLYSFAVCTSVPLGDLIIVIVFNVAVLIYLPICLILRIMYSIR